MMRLAGRADLPALTALWQASFGDRPEDIARFFAQLFPEIRVYLAQEGQTPAAMLCALPTTLVDDCGQSHTCAYFYAVCTAARFRGRGLCTRLLDYAAQQEAARGAAFAALVPDGAEKFDFYSKRGYQTCFYHRQYALSAGGSAAIGALRPQEYEALRALQLYGDYVEYPLPLLRWQDSVGRHSGAGLFRIETPQMICCAAAERWGSTLVLKELLPDCETAAAALAAHLGCTRVEVRTQGDEQPFGMLRPLAAQPAPQCAYLGLALD